MSAVAAIGRYRGPLIAQDARFGLAEIHHRLDRKHHSLSQPSTMSWCAEVRNLRFFMQLGSNPVPDKLSHYAETRGLHKRLHSRTNISHRISDPHFLDAAIQRIFSDLQQLLQFRRDLFTHRHRDRRISVISVEYHATVDRNDIAGFQNSLLRRNPMHDLFVDRRAQYT